MVDWGNNAHVRHGTGEACRPVLHMYVYQEGGLARLAWDVGYILD